MNYKRVIYLILFWIICLVGGGLYYSTTMEKFPCKISLQKDSVLNRVRLLMSYNMITFKLKQCAYSIEENPANWQRVEVCYVDAIGWVCSVYKAHPNRDEEILRIHLKHYGDEDILLVRK